MEKRDEALRYLSSASNEISTTTKNNLIEIKTCKEVPNTNQIYFNKKSEILYNQIYNYLKNELIILFKNIIYVIDE